jgi:protein-S-isoprenylcysteine O-methyltransferase Ste14
MTSYFFVGHPIATALFDGTVAAWAVTEVRQTLKRRTEATTRDRGSRFVIVLCAIGGFVLAALARDRVTAADFPSNAVTFGIGLALVWVGVGLRWWSFRTLGRYFTVDVMTSTDQPIITVGPYRIVRHPSYAALLTILAGAGMMYANWLSLGALVLLPLVGLLNRIRVEEAALSATLGEAYTSYARSHKRLIPFVW